MENLIEKLKNKEYINITDEIVKLLNKVEKRLPKDSFESYSIKEFQYLFTKVNIFIKEK
jgi:hypothetical protein